MLDHDVLRAPYGRTTIRVHATDWGRVLFLRGSSALGNHIRDLLLQFVKWMPIYQSWILRNHWLSYVINCLVPPTLKETFWKAESISKLNSGRFKLNLTTLKFVLSKIVYCRSLYNMIGYFVTRNLPKSFVRNLTTWILPIEELLTTRAH